MLLSTSRDCNGLQCGFYKTPPILTSLFSIGIMILITAVITFPPQLFLHATQWLFPPIFYSYINKTKDTYLENIYSPTATDDIPFLWMEEDPLFLPQFHTVSEDFLFRGVNDENRKSKLPRQIKVKSPQRKSASVFVSKSQKCPWDP